MLPSPGVDARVWLLAKAIRRNIEFRFASLIILVHVDKAAALLACWSMSLLVPCLRPRLGPLSLFIPASAIQGRTKSQQLTGLQLTRPSSQLRMSWFWPKIHSHLLTWVQSPDLHGAATLSVPLHWTVPKAEARPICFPSPSEPRRTTAEYWRHRGKKNREVQSSTLFSRPRLFFYFHVLLFVLADLQLGPFSPWE